MSKQKAPVPPPGSEEQNTQAQLGPPSGARSNRSCCGAASSFDKHSSMSWESLLCCRLSSAPFLAFYLFIFLLETRSHVVQTGLRFTLEVKMTLTPDPPASASQVLRFHVCWGSKPRLCASEVSTHCAQCSLPPSGFTIPL